MLPIPTIDEETETLIAVAKRLFPLHDFGRESPNWKVIRLCAFILHDAKVHNVAAKNGLMARTAVGDEQDEIGFAFNRPRKSATGARKDFALRVYGTPGASCPDDSRLTHTSGLRYATIGSAVVSALSYVDVSLAAIDVGSVTRLSKGEALNFDVPPVGLNEVAELQLDIDQDGVDNETAGPYAQRLLAHTQDPPKGGSASDYRAWITQITGIESAYVYALRRGLGTVDVAALHAGRGTVRTLLVGEQAALAAHLEALRPVTDNVRVLTVTPKPVNVELLLVDNGSAAAARDWDDVVPGTVSTWTLATRTLVFFTRPTSIKAGDRIVLGTVLGTGEFYKVEALSGVAGIVLEAAPSAPPLLGDLVYSGGAAATAARDAVLAHFDTLGPSNTDAQRWGAWEGTLRLGALATAARVTGIVDAVVLDPIAAVNGADLPWPNDGTVELLTPGRIVIRWQ